MLSPGRIPSQSVWCGAVLLALGLFVAGGTFGVNLWRYQTYRSAWPLDLAFFNHQLWNFWHDGAPLTLQPMNFYAVEGPEPWRMAQLRLLTFLVLPLYGLWPGVPFLLAIQSVACGFGVWPMYLIASRRSGSQGWGLVAAAFYAVSPIVWLVGAQDFRYLTVGIPLALMAYDALDNRSTRRYMLWSFLAMATRHVFALVLAVLAVARFAQWAAGRILARQTTSAPVGQAVRWLLGPLLLSAAWLLLDQLGLWLLHGPDAVRRYWSGMRRTAAVTSRLQQPVQAVLEHQGPYIVRYGPALALAGLAAPEFGVATLVLTYPFFNMGQWAVHPADHFARYSIPGAIALLIAVAVTFGRLGRYPARRWPRFLATGWMMLASVSAGLLVRDTLYLPSAFTPQEREVLNRLEAKIPEDAGVLASHHPVYGSYSVLAPFSSRTRLYDYNQLPRRRTATGAMRDLSLSEVLGDVQWCILAQPPVWAPDQTDAVRRAIEASDQFEPVDRAGRIMVYRRRSDSGGSGESAR